MPYSHTASPTFQPIHFHALANPTLSLPLLLPLPYFSPHPTLTSPYPLPSPHLAPYLFFTLPGAPDAFHSPESPSAMSPGDRPPATAITNPITHPFTHPIYPVTHTVIHHT